jgi:hypothetical protein
MRCLRPIVGIAVVFAITALPSALHANPRTTAEVIQNQLDGFCPGGVDDPADVDQLMEDLHPDALKIFGDNSGNPPRTLEGAEAIGADYAGLFALVGNGCGVQLLQQVVDGQRAYIQWIWPDLGGLAPGFDGWGSDTFVVKGGKIRFQTVFLVLTPRFP